MKLNYWINDYIKYLRDKDFDIDPLPKIILDNSSNDLNNILIRTGYYDCENQRIVVFTNNRHPKDILRSLAHELAHHHQYLRNNSKFLYADKSGTIEKNGELRNIESEAYMLGNLYFRMYTENFKDK